MTPRSTVLAGLAVATIAWQALAEPLVTLPGKFTVATDQDGTTITVTGGGQREIGNYRLDGCLLDGAGSGVFALNFPGLNERLVAASCQTPDGPRFFLLAPKRDSAAPVLRALAGKFTILADRIDLREDAGSDAISEAWHPGVPQDPGEIEWSMRNAAAADGRAIGAPASVADPEFKALAAHLHEIATTRDAQSLLAMAAPDVLTSFGGGSGLEDLRQMTSEDWFWPEFARIIAGGGVLTQGDGGKGAVFPSAFFDWPDDLDAFDFLYGDLAGAVLRAGPSAAAPALTELHGQILARGPALPGDDLLREAGWIYLCRLPAGCGYARDTEVRSPIDYRARFSKPGPNKPWVLETLVAGD
ncbi:MAG TPA: hypothetical protein VLA52_02550 [Thermohalobaculum sp.]|nr:hypothetical protein [Thermohalobaculum sp.]